MESKQVSSADNTDNSVGEYRYGQIIDLLVSMIGVLLLGVDYANIDNSFFVSVTVLILPIFAHIIKDMAGFKKDNGKIQKFIVYGIRIVAILILVVCVCGYLGVLHIYSDAKNAADNQNEISNIQADENDVSANDTDKDVVVYVAVEDRYMFFPGAKLDVRVIVGAFGILIFLQWIDFFLHSTPKEKKFIQAQLSGT